MRVPGWPSKALTMCSELVRICKFLPARWGHIWSLVDPPSIITASRSTYSDAAARPIASFSARLRAMFS